MNEKFYKELGIAIKDERIAKRLTQQELADKLKITRSCLANWEQGRRAINIDELFKICSVLKVDTNELVKKVEKYVN